MGCSADPEVLLCSLYQIIKAAFDDLSLQILSLIVSVCCKPLTVDRVKQAGFVIFLGFIIPVFLVFLLYSLLFRFISFSLFLLLGKVVIQISGYGI